MMERLYRIGEVAKKFGVTPMTVRRWINAGKLKATRTLGGEYRIPESEVKRLLQNNDNNVKAVIYARVSSRDQKNDLERQVEYLKEYATSKGYQIVDIVTDIASGLNENRKGLKKLFKLTENQEIDVILITYKDRLTRFGFMYLERYFNSHNVRIEPIFGELKKEPREELIDDLISIITSFAGKLYGMRSKKKKKVVEDVKRIFRDG